MKLLFAIVAIVLIAGCAAPAGYNQNQTQAIEYSTSQEEAAQELAANSTQRSPQQPYSGTVLAGSSAPVIDFNAADYSVALQSDKLVVLYFYANWCPICRAEVPQMYAAFNELTTDKAIGFRVNFNDDQTDNNERNLARQFGVPYQHTKVFLKDGAVVLKSSEAWDKNRYLLEISSSLQKYG